MRDEWLVIRKTVYCATLRWFIDRSSSKGAALAFYTLFSLAPLLVLVLSVAGIFLDEQLAQQKILQQLQQLVGVEGAYAIQILLESARRHPSGASANIVVFVLLVIGATSVFAELKASLDDIWHVNRSDETGLWQLIRTRLLSFGIVIGLGFLALVSLMVDAGLAIFTDYWGKAWPITVYLWKPLSSALAFTVITALFAMIYKLLPEVSLSWSDVVIGALVTACLFTLGKYAIGAYLGNGPVVSASGAAGALAALLLWLYYSAQIFLFGAEFTRQYTLRLGSHRTL